ncbi:MAG: helix-turn-helix transcriptional regulator, partial [Muribaculaceae bacterium]|nr:helix-turn-helix transcriptional regulator [Muribaculaceae bacterium]
MENTEKDWRNNDIKSLDYTYIGEFDSKKYQKYRKYLRDGADFDVKNMWLLQRHLRLKRFENHMSITYLSMIIGCSRIQYNRMERGENRFKDEQLEVLATFYGEEPPTYKDMQDVDAIIKATGYFFNDKDRAFLLVKMTFFYMFLVFDNEGKQTDFSVFIPKDIIETTPISKEIQKQKWLEIIENLQSRRL